MRGIGATTEGISPEFSGVFSEPEAQGSGTAAEVVERMEGRPGVLVANGDRTILEDYRTILGIDDADGREDLELVPFSRSSELVAFCRAEYGRGRRFPLAFLDVGMGGRNGFDTAEEIHRIDPDVTVVIVAAQDHVLSEELRQRLDARVFLVRKPLDREAFRLLVRTLLREWEGKRALAESEATVRLLMESVDVGIVLVDPSTHVIEEVNGRAAALFGASRERILGRRCHAFLCPAEEGTCPITDLGLVVERADRTMLRADGSRAPVLKSVRSVQIGGREKLLETFVDISARKRAEEELRQTWTFLENVLNASGDPLFVKDRQHRWVLSNDAHCALIGRSREELLGRTDFDFFPPQEAEVFWEKDELVFATGETNVNEEFFTDAAGVRHINLTTKARYVDEAGNAFIVGGVRDISARKREEEELRRINDELAAATERAREMAFRAEEANRAKSAFLSHMSHEIRTPLNAILGFAQVLERDPGLTPEQVAQVRTINRSGTHLLHLINDILDLSKIEAGRTTCHPTVFDLHALVGDLEILFRPRSEARGLLLLVERDETLPRAVVGDEGKVRQVLMNLLGNAVKFTERGGVTLRVRSRGGESAPGGSSGFVLEVEVADSGLGIAPEAQERIFLPFQQAEAGIQVGGTGLGLAISREFARMMGGDLGVQSEVGRGSTFRFEVPLARAEGEVGARSGGGRRVVGIERGSGLGRILVVDDREENREVLRALLEPVGFFVEEAADGQEALERLAAHPPAAVLLDMRMPKMDGYEVLRRMGGSAVGRSTPVVAVTASAFEDDRLRILAQGARGYLRKPYRPEELFDVLESCLGVTFRYAAEVPDDAGPEAPLRPTAGSGALPPDATLPEDLLRALRDAVADGDRTVLMPLMDRVEAVDAAVARALRALADQYDYEILGAWLERGVPEHG